MPKQSSCPRRIEIYGFPPISPRTRNGWGTGLLPGLPVLLALTVGLTAMPLRLTAQESAQNPAPAVQPAQSSAPSEVVKSQEEQNNVFRLEGPVVKWTAGRFIERGDDGQPLRVP
jgi:hypothetical protein